MPAQKPANKPADKPAEKPAKPALDLSSLVVEDAPTLPKHTRKSESGPNPFLAVLKDSHEKNVGKQVTVPKANAKDVTYLIRQASNELGLGATIVEKPAADGKVTLHFAGKKRRPRRSKAEIAAAKKAEAEAAKEKDSQPANA